MPFIRPFTVQVPPADFLADPRLAPVIEALDAFDAARIALDDADVARELLMAQRATDLAREKADRDAAARAAVSGVESKKKPFRAPPQHEYDADLADADAKIAALEQAADRAVAAVDRAVIGHSAIIGAIAADALDKTAHDARVAQVAADNAIARLRMIVHAARQSAFADALGVELAKRPNASVTDPTILARANGRVRRTFATPEGARVNRVWTTNGAPLSPHDEIAMLSSTVWDVDAHPSERALVTYAADPEFVG
jgi:hypothetical protein